MSDSVPIKPLETMIHLKPLSQAVDELVEWKDSADKQVEVQQSSRPLSELVDYTPLSKPYIHIILSKSHVTRACNMVFPARFHPNLPSTTGSAIKVPATIVSHGKTWKSEFIANRRQKKLANGGWRVFVSDNNLKVGDAVFWELIESSSEEVNFRVQIIRGEFPPELEAEAKGNSITAPIVID